MVSHSIGCLLVIYWLLSLLLSLLLLLLLLLLLWLFCFDWWLLLFVAVVKYTSKLLLLIFILILLLSLLRFYLLLQFSGIETTSIFIMDSAHCTFFGTYFLERDSWRGSTFPAKCQLSSGPGLLRSLPFALIGGSNCCPWSCTDVEAGPRHLASGWFPFATSATRVALRSGPGDPVVPGEGWLLIRWRFFFSPNMQGFFWI